MQKRERERQRERGERERLLDIFGSCLTSPFWPNVVTWDFQSTRYVSVPTCWCRSYRRNGRETGKLVDFFVSGISRIDQISVRTSCIALTAVSLSLSGSETRSAPGWIRTWLFTWCGTTLTMGLRCWPACGEAGTGTVPSTDHWWSNSSSTTSRRKRCGLCFLFSVSVKNAMALSGRWRLQIEITSFVLRLVFGRHLNISKDRHTCPGNYSSWLPQVVSPSQFKFPCRTCEPWLHP